MVIPLARPISRLILVVGAITFTSVALSGLDPEVRVILDASSALQGALQSRNAIPASIMRRAQAIAVFPAATTDAMFHQGAGVIGGRGREAGRWLPAVVSFKAKLRMLPDRRVGNVIIVALTRKGFDYLSQKTFSLSPASVIPAGPVGQDTAENMKADFVAYGQYRVTFAGVALEELTIEEDAAALNALYGPGVDQSEILNGRLRHAPQAALEWQQYLEGFFRRLQ